MRKVLVIDQIQVTKNIKKVVLREPLHIVRVSKSNRVFNKLADVGHVVYPGVWFHFWFLHYFRLNLLVRYRRIDGILGWCEGRLDPLGISVRDFRLRGFLGGSIAPHSFLGQRVRLVRL